MAWVDSAVNRTENESGVAEIIGAIILISVLVLAIGIIGVGLLSQPLPQKCPAVSVDVTVMGNTLYIRHEGGDSIPKGEFNITLDGVDKTDSFNFLDGSARSTWGLGETLYYVVPTGQSSPATIQIIYNCGSFRSSIMYTPKIITPP